MSFCRTNLAGYLKEIGAEWNLKACRDTDKKLREVEYKRQLHHRSAETDNSSSRSGLTSVESSTDDQILACFWSGGFLNKNLSQATKREASRKSSLGLAI